MCFFSVTRQDAVHLRGGGLCIHPRHGLGLKKTISDTLPYQMPQQLAMQGEAGGVGVWQIQP